MMQLQQRNKWFVKVQKDLSIFYPIFMIIYNFYYISYLQDKVELIKQKNNNS